MTFEEITTATEMKAYLDSYHYYRCAYHYTSLANLKKICEDNTLRFSQIKAMNDKMEADFAPDCHDYFFCLMKSKVENFGMWAMYGGLSPRKKGDTIEDIFVKIEFTYDQIKQLTDFNKEIKTRAIAYTQINKKERNVSKNLIYNCGGNKNTKLKSTDKILEGYIKDVAWSYENELRLCIKGTKQQQEKAKNVKLPENFIPQLKVFASPLYTTKEIQEIFDKHAKSVPASNRPVFAPNNYEGTVLIRK